MRFTVTSESVPFLFLTPKSEHAILVQDPMLYDVLRQAALDQAVSRIKYVRSVTLENGPHVMNCLILVRRGFSEIVDLGPRMKSESGENALFIAAARSLEARIVLITRDSVLQEPRCSNSRLVWAERHRYVPLAVRHRILEQLRIQGPTTIEGIGSDLKNAVLALACEAALNIDIDSQDIENAQISAFERGMAVEALRALYGFKENLFIAHATSPDATST